MSSATISSDSVAGSDSVPVRRVRRREETIREIVAAAEGEVVRHGERGVALRAVARAVGMTVQSLYHYFGSRDELVAAVIANAHHDLADTVEAARDASSGAPSGSRMLVVSMSYRRWAVEHPQRFRLAYGVPAPPCPATTDRPTDEGLRRIRAVFRDVIFDDWTPEELRDVEVSPCSDELVGALRREPDVAGRGVPPGAATLFLSAWAQLHGGVVLEVFGHLPRLGAHASDDLFRASMAVLRGAVDAHRVRG